LEITNLISDWQLKYVVSPLILTGGISTSAPNGALPFLAFSNPAAYGTLTGALGAAGINATLDDAFGAFTVAPGGTLINQSIPKYPLATMQVAANATLFEPLNISLIWETPMRGSGAWSNKIATMSALQATLAQHNAAGGTYTVLTPAFKYTNLIMLSLTDASRGQSPLPQNAWRFDFERPLIVQQETTFSGAQSQLMNAITNGLPSNGVISLSAPIGQATGFPNTGAISLGIPTLSGIPQTTASSLTAGTGTAAPIPGLS
jgi:hypothetical protein